MIRKANLDDICAINKMGLKLHKNFIKNFHIETEINSELAIVLVNEDSKSVNGYLYALDFGDNIDLLSIYVDENYRNKKIGTKLLKSLIDKYCNYSSKTITLEVECQNIEAFNLYKSLNFKVVNKRYKYYDDKDAYLMKWGI